MFRITEDPSSGSLVQCLAKNYKNGSIVSVDMDKFGVMATYIEQYTVKNFTYFNSLDTIFIIHFTRQMIPIYVSHCCKHNLHVTPLETKYLI